MVHPELLNEHYPKALPVYSVDTDQDAIRLFTLAANMGYGNRRLGLPHILDESIDNLPQVAEHLHERYMWMKEREKKKGKK